ncbi:phosphate/phosphite/phosphonate ABC transporter substrate-binding protein [Motiliproteus coralliicola]|uniref:Phosphate/phosphite/phosphonate ABC transporter substrate-binding protein n=1 Tax=Motiliproteus coralliicola TaxID=2283196 RepID=A0A369WBV7_9GAMM|nr:phosphate/phosphite/phosphonate ABC transporter substrate-binding protein [Motiliproteus coralliicola]RDE19137.1 phosphate/phosphite/phosphonate ABC transporter substrate-binding protein [Motiliproteus coralliicola]
MVYLGILRRKAMLWLPLLALLLPPSPQAFSSEQVDDDMPTLRVAIIPHRSSLGNEQAYGKLFKRLQQQTGLKFRWIGSKTYDDVISHLASGTADIGYVGPFSYVDVQDNHGVRLICRTLSKKGQEFYHSMIVTRADSGIESLDQLGGKRFTFTDPKSTSGYLFPMAQLRKTGLDKDDFAEVKFVTRHANSLMAVYRGQADAGATSYTAIDKVDIDFDQMKILWKSEPIYRGPWIARKGLPDDQFNKLRQAMLELGQPDTTQDLFDGLTTKGFVAGSDSDYDNVREVIQLMGLN